MIRVAMTILFMFFLPGYTLLKAIYPLKGEFDEKLDILYKIAYSIGLSAAIFVFLGFLLGNVQVNGGLFIGRNIWASLIIWCIVFFFIGWYRGSYRNITKFSPRSGEWSRTTDLEKEDRKKISDLKELAMKRGALKERIKSSDGKEKENLKEELEKVEEELKELEKDRERDF